MKRVLIVKISSMGDIIHALPVLDYLHKVVPGIEIDWVVEEAFREVLEGNPLIDRLHTVKTRVWRKKPFARETRHEIAALKAALRGRSYDLVFDIQGNLKSGLACWLTGAANRLGFERDDLQESANLFFTTRQIPLRRQDHHVTEKYLRVVSVPFARDFREMTLTSTISTTPADDANAEALLSTLGDGLVFLFHYGTTWQTKLWTEKGWVELGKAVLKRFPDSTILFSWGNESEKAKAAAISAEIGPGTRVIDRYGLKSFTALLKKVDLVVGGDTGPVHMAAAVGTPTVSFYRVTDGSITGPRGANHVTVQSPLHCTRCFRKACDKDAECRESITATAILAGIEKLLRG